MRPSKLISGQGLVEFALIFPLLFLLVMGLFDLGRAVFYSSTLNTAVREGTRYAIVQPDCNYKSNPGACTGAYLDSYIAPCGKNPPSTAWCIANPNDLHCALNCNNALSTANLTICNKIKNIFFTGELSSSTICIKHLDTDPNNPKIYIGIDFDFKPVTPGIILIGNWTMHVNSQMLRTEIAKP
jgi:hypothetical protein